MDLTCFVLHSSSIENSHSVVSSDKHEYFEKDDKTSWQNSVVANPVIQAEFKSADNSLPSQDSMTTAGLKSIPDSSSKQEHFAPQFQSKNLLAGKNPESLAEPRKGTASVIRLQAAQLSEVKNKASENATDNIASSPAVKADSSTQCQSQAASQPADLLAVSVLAPSVMVKDYSWTDAVSGYSGEVESSSFDTEESQGELTSSPKLDEIPSPREMEKFLTTDGQYVYAHKDSNGEYQYFYPTLNERENHNEKERNRRSRVTDACNRMRNLVPGITDKTDKATVFEETVRFLRLLRCKYQAHYDQMFCERRVLYKR